MSKIKAILSMSGLILLGCPCIVSAQTTETPKPTYKTVEVKFRSYDGYDMFGKLVVPTKPGKHPVVIYVQTAEGATVDMKRSLGGDKTFYYFDLYRTKLTEMNVAFFSYEGRGITTGTEPPRYEKIDRDIYDTSTLDNKVKDVISAVEAVKTQEGIDTSKIYLMGASECTLLAAEAASRIPKDIAGLALYGVLTLNMKQNFKYIMSDGAFLVHRQAFDTDHDGKISKKEFEADPKGFAKTSLQGAKFEQLDGDKDGFFTVKDLTTLTKVYLDACDNNKFEVLDAWAKVGAAVAVPKDWFKDHFAHKTTWDFLSQVDIPVGLFQGGMDNCVPIAGVKAMEQKAKKAGKTKMEFYYFPGLDHSLGIVEYFTKGTLPAGHKAIFAFFKKHIGS
jgi:dienelactone hydrolase